MFGKKSFVNMLEMIIVVIALFVAFSIFFPGFYYKSRWSDALLLLKNRDALLVADRVGQLHNYSFNSTGLQEFLDNLLGERGMITWSEAEGTIKSKLLIACNCTNDELNNLISWFKGLKINDRETEVLPCYTNLETINPCLSSSDVLLIFGSKNLSSQIYLNTLREYLKGGSGIIEIADWDINVILSDDVQQKIFGLGGDTNPEQRGQSEYDVFRDEINASKMPTSANAISYQPWKYFYHIPIQLFASPLLAGFPPVDKNLPSGFCDQLSTGRLDIQMNFYRFWICNSTKVYFDTDLNNSADVVVGVGGNLGIVDYYNNSLFWNFSLNYIDGQEKIGLSFKPNYKFSDFITHQGADTNLILPADDNLDRILIQASNRTEADKPIPGVILNASAISRVAWIANFTQNGIDDDERLLIISLLLWASSKRATTIAPELKLGFKTSYINSVNKDMFEIYKFTLGLGYPF